VKAKDEKSSRTDDRGYIILSEKAGESKALHARDRAARQSILGESQVEGVFFVKPRMKGKVTMQGSHSPRERVRKGSEKNRES